MRGLTRKLDYADLEATPDDGNRYEILDGTLQVTPPPSPLHQRVSRRLQRQLEAYFEARSLGEVFNAPIGVVLAPHDIVQPDLVVVTEPGLISNRAIEGPPLLAVEILSPSTRSHDRVAKFARYARLGIPHYWMVDPSAEWLEAYRLQEGSYVLAVRGVKDATIELPEFPGLKVLLADLWR